MANLGPWGVICLRREVQMSELGSTAIQLSDACKDDVAGGTEGLHWPDYRALADQGLRGACSATYACLCLAWSDSQATCGQMPHIR